MFIKLNEYHEFMVITVAMAVIAIVTAALRCLINITFIFYSPATQLVTRCQLMQTQHNMATYFVYSPRTILQIEF